MKLFRILILCLGIFYYFFISTAHMQNNKFTLDFAIPSYFGVNFLNDEYIDMRSEININIFGKILPTNMVNSYTFQLPSYLLVPFFYIFGLKILTVYNAGIIFGAGFIVLTYLILKYLFGDYVAILTVLLLSTCPTYMHYNTIALLATEPFINFFFAATILLFLLYLKTKKNYYILISALFFGAGFSIKLSYFSRPIALFIVIFLLFRKNLKQLADNINITTKTAILIMASIGASLFIIYNIYTTDPSIDLFYKHIIKSEKTIANIDNTNIYKNLKIRLFQVQELLLNRSYNPDSRITKFLNTIAGSGNKYLLYISLFSLLINPFLAVFLRYKNKDFSKSIYSVYILYLIMFCLSIFSPASLSGYQISYFFPFLQLSLAISCYSIYLISTKLKQFQKTAAIYISMGIFILFPLSINIIDSKAYVLAKELSGARIFGPQKFKELYKHIQRAGFQHIYIFFQDESFQRPLIFESKGKLKITKIAIPLSERNFLNIVSNKKDKLFVLIPLSKKDRQNLRILKNLSEHHNLSINSVSKVANERGLILYELIKIKKS